MELPATATTVDPLLRDVGVLVPHQRLVFGKYLPDTLQAVLVAQLVEAHPSGEGVVGRFYGVHIKGISIGSVFRPWAVESVGEVRWCSEREAWVQADGSVA